jgi:adenylate cyclase
MKLEIERKFLVRGAAWRDLATARERLSQGYLANTSACSIRVRRASGRGWLSVKGMQPGRSRPEYEYRIPEADAAELLAAFAEGELVEKTRHIVPVAGHRFEVDEFAGRNEGLIVAEIELASSDEPIPRPDWLGEEVTEDARFYNFRLASTPFSHWNEAEQGAVRAGRRPAGGTK